jgi:hypothetical protein
MITIHTRSLAKQEISNRIFQNFKKFVRCFSAIYRIVFKKKNTAQVSESNYFSFFQLQISKNLEFQSLHLFTWELLATDGGNFY